jgi:hypothetical protein
MSRRNARITDSPVLTGEIARDLECSRGTAWMLCKTGAVPARLRAGRFEVDRLKYERLLPTLRASRGVTVVAAATAA